MSCGTHLASVLRRVGKKIDPSAQWRKSVANILILDEEDDSRKLLERLLERNGHHAWAFVKPAEALECVANRKLDLVLMNVTTRSGAVLAILNELKRVNPDLKVMVIADYLPQEADEGEPADCLLVKPMDIDVVERKVRELLQHPSPELGSGTVASCNITGSLNK